ncbi:MAG: DUF4136 domain-containing protein [Planctomycetota bacterium]|jgi:hypothetical protein
MKTAYLSLFMFSLFFCVGCVTQKVSKPRVFTAFTGTVPANSSFCFISVETDIPNMPLDKRKQIDNRIKNALVTELEAKGFRLSDPTNAAFFVSFNVLVDDEAVEELTEGSNLLSDMFSGEKIHNGSLVVDIINQDMRPVWSGAYNADIVLNVSEQEKDARVANAVRQILKNFP